MKIAALVLMFMVQAKQVKPPIVTVRIVSHKDGTASMTAKCPKGWHPEDTKHLLHTDMTPTESLAALHELECVIKAGAR